MKTDKLKKLVACSEAVEWAKTQPNAKTAWAKCERGDWMLWLIGRITNSKPWSNERHPLLAACLDCADLVAHLRPKTQAKEIETLRDWIVGKVSQKDAASAVRQINAYAAYAAYADAAAYAADAAAYAASAAAYAAYASAADAAAYADAYADADADAAAAVRKKILAQCADIVRKHVPKPPRL